MLTLVIDHPRLGMRTFLRSNTHENVPIASEVLSGRTRCNSDAFLELNVEFLHSIAYNRFAISSVSPGLIPLRTSTGAKEFSQIIPCSIHFATVANTRGYTVISNEGEFTFWTEFFSVWIAMLPF